jgi:hypothetical protein
MARQQLGVPASRAADAATQGDLLALFNMVTVEKFKPTAGTDGDDQTAIQDALNSLVAGQSLYIMPGKVYKHSSTLLHSKSFTAVVGGGTMYAMTPAASSFKVTAKYSRIADITFDTLASTTRLDPYEAQRFLVDSADGIIIDNVKSLNSAATGLFITRTVGFTVNDMLVMNTLADGIHMTGGSTDGTVRTPTCINVGDDGVATVSYTGGYDSGLCKRITVFNATVDGSRKGRGVSIIGGEDVTYFNSTTRNTFGPGWIIASEPTPSNPTFGATRCKMLQGAIYSASQDTAQSASMRMVSGRTGYGITDCEMSGPKVYDTPSGDAFEIGAYIDNYLSQTGTMSGNVIRDVEVHNGATAEPIVYRASTTTSQVRTENIRRAPIGSPSSVLVLPFGGTVPTGTPANTLVYTKAS